MNTNHLAIQNLLLLIASYFFYGWWSWEFMLLLLLSTLLDYLYGFGVASANKVTSKIFLWLSIINNLGILAIFKYFNFFSNQFSALFYNFGIKLDPFLLDIALPVGISFYTFHGMSYVFDIYNGRQKPIGNFVNYAVFVSFFPLLVAGPIERAHHLLPQVMNPRLFNYRQSVEGGRLLLWGFIKKVIFADTLATNVDIVFNNYQEANTISLLTAAIAFSFQIYCDFSGYTDIALGTAKLLGFELLSNFKFPYFSRDLAEFWRRWHISLSSWFRDYLYIPLGGSKNGKVNSIKNTFIVFLVSGFWHGASWNYIVWGMLHAIGFLPLLLLNRNRRHTISIVAENKMFPTIQELVGMLGTFAYVTFAWIFFRSPDLSSSFEYLERLFTGIWTQPLSLLNSPVGKKSLLGIPVLILIDWWLRHDERRLRTIRNPYFRRFIYSIAILFIIIFLLVSEKQSFIYFQF